VTAAGPQERRARDSDRPVISEDRDRFHFVLNLSTMLERMLEERLGNDLTSGRGWGNKSQAVEIRHGAEMPGETRSRKPGDNDGCIATSK
jgi:hypothetical protein